MGEGKTKSRTFRRANVRVPSGKSVIHYVRKKPAKAQCANCGDYLKGVARGYPAELHSVSKSERRPERPYGGVLCSRCSRELIVNKFRNIFSLSSK